MFPFLTFCTLYFFLFLTVRNPRIYGRPLLRKFASNETNRPYFDQQILGAFCPSWFHLLCSFFLPKSLDMIEPSSGTTALLMVSIIGLLDNNLGVNPFLIYQAANNELKRSVLYIAVLSLTTMSLLVLFEVIPNTMST